MREPKRGSNLEGAKVRIKKCEGLTAHAGAFSTPRRALESVRLHQKSWLIIDHEETFHDGATTAIGDAGATIRLEVSLHARRATYRTGS